MKSTKTRFRNRPVQYTDFPYHVRTVVAWAMNYDNFPWDQLTDELDVWEPGSSRSNREEAPNG